MRHEPIKPHCHSAVLLAGGKSRLAIELRGTYRYADPAGLERALVAAREHAEDDLDVDWSRCWTRHGTQLRIHAQLSTTADRFAAAAVIEALAQTAIEGVVEAWRGGVAVDCFPSGEDS